MRDLIPKQHGCRSRSAALTLVGLLASSTIHACGSGNSTSANPVYGTPDAGPEPSLETGALCNPALTYEGDIQPFLASYCTGCHTGSARGPARNGAPAILNFDTEQSVLDVAATIDRVAGSGPRDTNEEMPPAVYGYSAPTMDERNMLSCWLACQL